MLDRIFWGRVAASLAALAAIVSPSAAQARSQDVMCQVVLRVEGGFTYRPEPGLSVLRLARADGPFRYDNPGNIIAFTCLRTELMPDETADLEILRAGYELNLAGRDDGMRIIHLALEEGAIRSTMYAGELSADEQRRLDRIVAAMQSRLAASTP